VPEVSGTGACFSASFPAQNGKGHVNGQRSFANDLYRGFGQAGITLARKLQLSETMEGAYLTAMAALGGAALGGFTSFATSWTTLRTQMKAEGNASIKSRRRKLYKLFINQASKVYGDALIHDSPELTGLIELHALVNRIRINSSSAVIESAANVVRVISETYNQPNRTPFEIEAMIADGTIDLLSKFSEACRAELE
jgi:hypothetical protein